MIASDPISPKRDLGLIKTNSSLTEFAKASLAGPFHC